MAAFKSQYMVPYYKVWSSFYCSWYSTEFFYQLLQLHLKEMFGIIYTPTEGDAVQNYSRLFRRPEGCFLNIRDQDSIESSMANFGGGKEIDYIVVTDGEEVI